MLNFRKLKQDFSPAILKEGKKLFEQSAVLAVKIISMDKQSMRISGRVEGNFHNTYESELEIDRLQSVSVESNCDCPYSYDCQHLAAIIFYLEKHLDHIVVNYSKDLEETSDGLEEDKELQETFVEAKSKECQRKDHKIQKDIMEEYCNSYRILSKSPFFIRQEKLEENKAELAVIFSIPSDRKNVQLQIALRLPFRSKPLQIPNVQDFCEALNYQEPLEIAGKSYLFTLHSFDEESREILPLLLHHIRFETNNSQKNAFLSKQSFGHLLSTAQNSALRKINTDPYCEKQNLLKSFYIGNLENPLQFSSNPASLLINLQYLHTPTPKLLLCPQIVLDQDFKIFLDEALLLNSVQPGLLYQHCYYRFERNLKRLHLQDIKKISNMTIPEPLFASFVEQSLEELMRFAKVENLNLIEDFVTLPYAKKLKAHCDIAYLNGELEAQLFFHYDDLVVPASLTKLQYEDLKKFQNEEGLLARDLKQEQKIINDLFSDFIPNEDNGSFCAKTEKKIVEFMTEVLPKQQKIIDFHCPENLLDQFIYDKTKFYLHLQQSKQANSYEIVLKIDGELEGIKTDLLWECFSAKKTYIELKRQRSKKNDSSQRSKILVFNIETLLPIIQIFDDLGIQKLEGQTMLKPLWTLASVHEGLFKDLPVEFSISHELTDLKDLILGKKQIPTTPIPDHLGKILRSYQKEGIEWLERLRKMHLNGILADDMGLGKTLQAITAITQYQESSENKTSLVVCPTSLIYNWQEEFSKFNPKISTLVIDGPPQQRKKLLKKITDFDLVITSYTLLQKDIETYKSHSFGYAILDEAQHIKNRGTRNAKSVKMVNADHRLILTGTPIENSLEELWSLFDFLMPGLLCSYQRFVEKYLRNNNYNGNEQVEELRRRVSPFILRRMKSDVAKDLPPISNILYHCQLTDLQEQLYQSYLKSAKDELTELVKKEGFEKVQMHVLATLTRLKQICCHPAIFAKEKAESGDSAKYEMLMELLQSLIESQHKTVIFSQYTKMLNIIRQDLEKQGLKFCYLDGSTKNRLSIVKKFNEDPTIPIFLVSLKAGGSGLNITGADTVIHYDMWWNPAVENQATDRVHRIGQTQSVSSYKLVTLNSIEEKILNLQNRKSGLVKQVISNEEEAMSKLTWQEVLELLEY